MKTLLLISAILLCQVIANSAMAMGDMQRRFTGKAQLPYCTISDKLGRTVFLTTGRGDWSTMQISYSVAIQFMNTSLVNEPAQITATNSLVQVFESRSLKIALTKVKMEDPYETHTKAIGFLTIKDQSLLKYFPAESKVSCEYVNRGQSQE